MEASRYWVSTEIPAERFHGDSRRVLQGFPIPPNLDSRSLHRYIQISDKIIAESYFDVHVRTKEAAEWYQTKYDNKQLEPDEKMGIGRHVYLRAQIEEVGHFGESELKEEEGGKEPDGGMFKLELD